MNSKPKKSSLPASPGGQGLVVRGMRARLSAAFGLKRSSSYWQHTQPAKDAALLTHIKAVMDEHPAYGHERIALELKVSRERIRQAMQANELQPAIRRVRPWNRPKNDGLTADLQNLIRDMVAFKPSHIWASDFTYIWFRGKWYYLATVLDLFTREIVGWQLGRRHKAQLIHLAYCDALSAHPPPAILHADQGSEYTAGSTKQLVGLTGGQMSYSDRGSPWQNGFQESFYNNFKLELGDLMRFEHEGELFEAIAKQIYYYNHKRIHTALKTKPVLYREAYLAKTGSD